MLRQVSRFFRQGSSQRKTIKPVTPCRSYATRPFPSRPGYGLGSWIPPAVVQDLKEEAAARNRIAVYDEISNDIESTMRELKTELTPLQNEMDDRLAIPDMPEVQPLLDSLQASRVDAFKKKVQAYQELFKVQTKQLGEQVEGQAPDNNFNPTGDAKGYSTYAVGIESGIDWDRSKIQYVDRGHETITVTATFLDNEDMSQGAHSASKKVQSAVLGSKTSLFGNTNVGTLAHAAGQTFATTAERHNIESTIVVSAFATHRMSKQFSPLVLDADKLRAAWNYYYESDPVDLQNLTMPTPVSQQEQPSAIAMVTEELLGSAFVGLIHIVQKASTETFTSTDAAAESLNVKRQATVLATFTNFGLDISNEVADRISALGSAANFDLRFDMVTMGYIPTIKSNVLTQVIQQFKTFDPENMSVVKNGYQLNDLPPETRVILNANQEQVDKRKNMASVISATIAAVAKTDRPFRTLDANTFMIAFDDFVQGIKTQKGVGAPVGLNLKVFSKYDVEYETAKKYFPNNPFFFPPLAGAQVENPPQPQPDQPQPDQPQPDQPQPDQPQPDQPQPDQPQPDQPQQ